MSDDRPDIRSCFSDLQVQNFRRRLTITTYNVLQMLEEWKIARPYNFLLLPMVHSVFGFAFHRQSNEKVLLWFVRFSSKQEQLV